MARQLWRLNARNCTGTKLIDMASGSVSKQKTQAIWWRLQLMHWTEKSALLAHEGKCTLITSKHKWDKLKRNAWARGGQEDRMIGSTFSCVETKQHKPALWPPLCPVLEAKTKQEICPSNLEYNDIKTTEKIQKHMVTSCFLDMAVHNTLGYLANSTWAWFKDRFDFRYGTRNLS